MHKQSKINRFCKHYLYNTEITAFDFNNQISATWTCNIKIYIVLQWIKNKKFSESFVFENLDFQLQVNKVGTSTMESQSHHSTTKFAWYLQFIKA